MSDDSFLVIGLAGKAGSGKDTIAAHLSKVHGFKHVELAGPIKFAMASAFGIPLDSFYDRDKKEKPVDPFGISPRRMAQLFGTEFGREMINEDCWLMVANKAIDCARNMADLNRCGDKEATLYRGAVISDIRYDNEAQWFKDRYNTEILRIHRDGVDAVESHSSEAGISDSLVDCEVYNSDTIEFLLSGIDAFMRDV